MTSATFDAREPFHTLSAVAVPLSQANIDTDQIIPARFLSLPRDELKPAMFRDVRLREDGSPRPEFNMNRPEYSKARVIVAGKNFGCGSSREMAVWVLKDNDFKVVIAPSFGDIFYNNCFQNSMLPIELPEARVNDLLRFLLELPGGEIKVDLEAQTVTAPDGQVDRFEIDPFRKECLLKGIDDITLTLGYDAAIQGFEHGTNGPRV